MTVEYHKDQGMGASITGKPVDTRGYNKVSFHNVYDAGTPSGDFTYEFSNNPEVLNNPDHPRAGWHAIVPDVLHGTQPAGSGSGPTSMSAVIADTHRFVRQIWTHTAGDATDKLDTYVDLDKT